MSSGGALGLGARSRRAALHGRRSLGIAALELIQGLAGVISISRDPDLSKQHADYISGLVDKMSVMVDELLNEDSRQIIRAEELARYARSYGFKNNRIAVARERILLDF